MTGESQPYGYLPRIADGQIERLLRIFGAIEIAGTKWCGKTWAALHHGSSISYIDESMDVAKADPKLMLLGERPHVIDEWQLVPPIWDAVRHEVDRERGLRGGWILTGSSTPIQHDEEESTPKHSGAGRIGRIRMHPMSLAESNESSGEVSLSGLFGGRFRSCKVESNTLDLLNIACRGGWPEALDLNAADAQYIARDYLRLTFSESVPKHGKDGETAKRVVSSISRNLGQATTYKTFLDDMFGAEENPEAFLSEKALSSYLDLLKRMYLVEEVGGWVPPMRSRKRLMTKPKRYLADPSLAVASLGMSPESLINDWQTFGLIFENLCMRDLSVYAGAHEMFGGGSLRYYRDDSGLEADAIIELTDGRWAAFEIKASEEKVPGGIDNLKRLKKKLCANPKARTKPPEFMAVIVGISEYAREVEDGIFVIPIRALGK